MDRSGEPDDIAPRTSTLRRSQGYADAALSVSELFRAHHLELVRLAVVMVGDLATAEDVVQDCFERLHRRWHVIREPGRALAYARSSVPNGCRSVHRRSAVSRRYGPWLAQPADAAVPDAAAATDDRGQLAAGRPKACLDGEVRKATSYRSQALVAAAATAWSLVSRISR